MAPTPDQMTAQLTARLDGPHSDHDTAAVARLAAEAVRFLNYATQRVAGLTFPATACTVTGELACAAAGLGQLSNQIGRFLARELAGRRLNDDQGSDPAVGGRVDEFLATAAAAGTALAKALGAAQSHLARLYQAESSAAGQPDLAVQIRADGMNAAALASDELTTWTFPGEPATVGRCRNLARRLAADEDQAEAAALCVSELVTNALVHSRSGLPGGWVTISISACPGQDGLRISVHDDGPRAARPLRGGPGTAGLAESGRGLRIVAAVAADWGISQPADDQGIAWCVIPAVRP